MIVKEISWHLKLSIRYIYSVQTEQEDAAGKANLILWNHILRMTVNIVKINCHHGWISISSHKKQSVKIKRKANWCSMMKQKMPITRLTHYLLSKDFTTWETPIKMHFKQLLKKTNKSMQVLMITHSINSSSIVR